MSAFRSTFAAQWHALRQTSAQPLKLWAMDEARFGLQTIRRRRLTLRGVKPVGAYQQRFQNFYVYGAVCPSSGEGYFAAQRTMNATHFESFVRWLSDEQPHFCHVLLLDNSKTHLLSANQVPANVRLLFQPPYAPEVNPCERVWQEAKSRLAWYNPPDLLALHDRVAHLFEDYLDAELRTLTAYDYLILGLAADCALNAVPLAA